MKEFIEKLNKKLTYLLNNFGEHCEEWGSDQEGECRGKSCSDCVLKHAIEIVSQLAEEYNDGWISVEDRLPEDCDNRFYMCIVENHEEDLPMFSQYDENYGFGFWKDIYDEHTLGFIDSEFRTNEELGYEKVVAWQNIPSYQPKGE